MPEEIKKELITYRQVEAAMSDFRIHHNSEVGFDQIENVMVDVRERMQVDPVTRIEAKKESYLKFTPWLASIVGKQISLKAIPSSDSVIDFIWIERAWEIAGKKLDLSKISKKLNKKLGSQFLIETYINLLTKKIRYFMPWVSNNVSYLSSKSFLGLGNSSVLPYLESDRQIKAH